MWKIWFILIQEVNVIKLSVSTRFHSDVSFLHILSYSEQDKLVHFRCGVGYYGNP